MDIFKFQPFLDMCARMAAHPDGADGYLKQKADEYEAGLKQEVGHLVKNVTTEE